MRTERLCHSMKSTQQGESQTPSTEASEAQTKPFVVPAWGQDLVDNLKRNLLSTCPVCHPPTFQLFWRCEHHPSALENFAALRSTCDFECHTQDLKWHHAGVHPTPKSWPATRELP